MNKTELQQSATGTESRSIRRFFTEDEIIAFQEKFTTNEILKAETEDELKEIKDEFNLRIKSFKSTSKYLLTNVKNKFVDETREVYLLPNHETGEMEFYDTMTGALVDTRRLRPDEKQSQLKINKAI